MRTFVELSPLIKLLRLFLVSMLALDAPLWASELTPVTIVHAGILLTVPGTSPKTQQSVVIKGGKILAIVDGYVDASEYTLHQDAEQIDLRDSFVMPGMIDMHVHLTMKGSIPAEDLTKTTHSDYAMVALENARKTLLAGVTTVRDTGAHSSQAIIAVRDAINRGAFPGPRIIAAGKALSATAGHADHFGVREDYADLYQSSGVCDGVYDCRRAVRDQYKIGAEVIKVMATGGGADRNGKADSAPEMFDDELHAIVETAHRLNLKVTAHAHGTAGINAALSAGVDSIEHSSYLNDESIRLYKKTGAHIVATASLPRYFQQDPDIPDSVKKLLAKKSMIVSALLTKAHKEGVTFSMGTDAGISNHGENAEELVAYVEIGMTPMQAIEAATVNAAALLGLSDDIGTLEVGKEADLIALSRDPLVDITAMRVVSFVMRNGTIHRQL